MFQVERVKYAFDSFLQCYIYIFSHALLYFSHQVSQAFCLRASAVPPSEPLACLMRGVNADGCKKPGKFALNRTALTALHRMFYITCIGSIMFCLGPRKKNVPANQTYQSLRGDWVKLTYIYK